MQRFDMTRLGLLQDLATNLRGNLQPPAWMVLIAIDNVSGIVAMTYYFGEMKRQSQ